LNNQSEIESVIPGDVWREMHGQISSFASEFDEFVYSKSIKVSELPPLKKIELVEAYLNSRSDCLKADFFPVNHQFSGGVYAREFFLPKGYLVVGKVHKGDHFLACTVGDCTMTTQEGSYRIQPHYIEQAKSGTKRIVFAHEDTVLTTFHKTDLDGTDIEAVEDEIAEMSDISWVDSVSGIEEVLCQL
jgi:hypothetical protein